MSCCLCGSGVEDREHLFVHCLVSRQIYISLFGRVLRIPDVQSWSEEVDWIGSKLKKQTEMAEVGRVIWQSWVSNIWRERCRRLYAGKVLQTNVLLKLIQSEVECFFDAHRVSQFWG
ncbi:unnamed protein product [Linum tenue]|uniref:Reverse transcriptase zinc-binding domain-containing protein n=1 Tax=Linum tenue TaxID=586396 RepID=A0AAV0I7P8_9ROSI|nr:unnamed protein product [Linum tenue]